MIFVRLRIQKVAKSKKWNDDNVVLAPPPCNYHTVLVDHHVGCKHCQNTLLTQWSV